ncbi:MAG: GNAT family N-acetyltransferase [Chloroflexi bacterium]|nr:GNAT family N-acetyltransferase [Chloroflexota bacterium]
MSLKPHTLIEQFSPIAFALPRDLGDGLLLRPATRDDAEPLAQFNGRIFGRDHFDEHVAAWTRDFMSLSHPAVGPSNVLVVVDTNAGAKIVSSMCLIPQTWTYAGIPFGVGRPEAVGTDPEYRRRGLVRAMFETLHARSAAMGHLVQGITGILRFYRQFGYEYALDLGGGRSVPFSSIPRLKEGEPERYHLRPMTVDDLAFVQPLYQQGAARSLVACVRPDWYWHAILGGYSPESFEVRLLRVIETEVGRPVGYVAGIREMGYRAFPIGELEVVNGQSLRAVMPSVLPGLKEMAEMEAAAQRNEVNALFFMLGREHPVFDAIPEYFARTRPPYGWYLRVPDLVALLRRIIPVLEERLAKTALAGHSGEIKIDEYVRGTRIIFDRGKISAVEPWEKVGSTEGNAGFPPFTFLQLVFGFRSLAELRASFPDVWASDEAAVLLDVLFPRRSSNLIPVG